MKIEGIIATFVLTGLAYFSGRHHSEEAKWKMHLAKVGKPHTEEHKRNIGLAGIGRKHTVETRRKMSLAQLGLKKGIKQSPEHIEKCRLTRLGKHHSEESKQRKRLSMLKNFKNELFVLKFFERFRKKPNLPEIKLNNILQSNYPNEWKYVGDYSFWIDGKNPDFVNTNGKKLIIELFGDYWHRGDSGEERIASFKALGYATLIIREHELKNLIDVQHKIEKWMESVK